MDDVRAVRRIERVGDLHGQFQQRLVCEWAGLQALGERLAFQVLDDKEVGAIVLADVVECTDVGMGERGDRFGFAREALPLLGITGREDLDRDCAVQARVAGFVDLAHAPGAECAENFVRAKSDAGSKRHRVARSVDASL